MSTNTNFTHSGLRTRPSKARSVNIVRPDSLPRALFVAELLARHLPHVQRDAFRGQATPARLLELGDPVLIRSDTNGDEVEAFLHLPGRELVLVDTGYGQVSVEAAATTAEAARATVVSLRQALESEPPPVEKVSMAFWMRGDCGGEIRHREIDAPSFAAIAENYAAAVREALERLVATRTPDAGRLILWRGVPGTGKSHALRALARVWAPWCSTHLIMDPEELLGRGGAYMLDVLTSDNGAPDRWRLLVLEDAGELIAADARALAGQALSRLLNVADGVIGQGTSTMILITTNEPVGRLHPAARRPGRCLADIEFTPLAVDEANSWLAARGLERRVDQPTPLAELFAEANDRPVTAESAAAPPFGFSRALHAVLASEPD